jgi:hypothetical protein
MTKEMYMRQRAVSFTLIFLLVSLMFIPALLFSSSLLITIPVLVVLVIFDITYSFSLARSHPAFFKQLKQESYLNLLKTRAGIVLIVSGISFASFLVTLLLTSRWKILKQYEFYLNTHGVAVVILLALSLAYLALEPTRYKAVQE